MPTYQYRCADCGEERDVVQSFSDDALTVCPVCDGRFRKVFSAVGVVFKGSGFYRNDSRSSSTASGNGSSKNGQDGSGDTSSESSSESAKSSDSGTKADSTSKESKSGTKDSGSSAKQPSAA